MPKNRIKKEYELLLPFIQTPWRSFTFKDIKKLTKNKSDSYVYSILKKYVEEKALIQEYVGNVILYKLSISNHKTQNFAGFISEIIAWNSSLPFDVINKILKNINTTYFTLLITGSYSKGTQNVHSDLDLVIICDNKQDVKHQMAQIHSICEISIPQVHPYIFKESEFLEMLINEQANYGKAIVQNNKLIYGAANYFNILNEAMSHGFDDKKLY